MPDRRPSLPPDEPLVLAVPKGRILSEWLPLAEAAGLDASLFDTSDRRLVREAGDLRVLLLKPDDVPTYVEYGAADLGVVGRDVLAEREYDLYVPLDLGLGACRMVVAGLPGHGLEDSPTGRPIRVATKYPTVTMAHVGDRGLPIETVFVQGSVELAPLVGLADVVVDIVQTGETLRRNGLVELETLFDVTSVVVANRAGFKLKQPRIAPLLRALGRAAQRVSRNPA